MRTRLLLAILLVGLAAVPAQAARWSIGIGIGLPVFAPCWGPCYYPRPVYVAPAPVVVAPAPVYVAPAPAPVVTASPGADSASVESVTEHQHQAAPDPGHRDRPRLRRH